MEGVIALAVLSVAATAVITTGTSELRYYARSHQETVAERVAASRLELVASQKPAPVVGVSTFAAPLPEATAEQTVTREAPGLFRVAVVVKWKAADGGDGVIRLATLVAREERP
jgi:type II secretory pathway pseudopilin PulG